eukprot:515747_1
MCRVVCILICCGLFIVNSCNAETSSICKGQTKGGHNSGDGGENEFKFDAWIEENNLHDIRDLLIKHKMTSPETLNTNAREFVELITDSEFSAKGHAIATQLLAAIQQVKVVRIYITKEEEEAMDQLNQYNEQILRLKQEINEAKDLLSKNVEECEHDIDVSFTQLLQ